MTHTWYRTFEIGGVLVAFKQMKKTEGLSTKRLFQALESDVPPSTDASNLKQARREYDNSERGSLKETAALKQLARYYPTDVENEALAPKLDYGSDSERSIVEFHYTACN